MRLAAAALAVLALATGAAAAPDHVKPGTLAVGVTTVTLTDASRDGRTLPVELWYPARTAGRDAAPLRKRRPLVLVVHGLCGSRLYYDYLVTHLASRGFLVAAPDLTGVTAADCVSVGLEQLPLDVAFVARTLHDPDGPAGRWARRVRGATTALVGNSLGGFAVFEAVKLDAGFTAVVGLAPAVGPAAAPALDALTPPRAWMLLGATGDDTVRFAALTQPLYEALDAPAFLVRFTGGGHTGFSDENPDTEPDPRQAQHDATLRTVTPFLLRYAAGKQRAGRALAPRDDGTTAVFARPE
jgi:dienelactone hydrolase